jgi:hypothetical protein
LAVGKLVVIFDADNVFVVVKVVDGTLRCLLFAEQKEFDILVVEMKMFDKLVVDEMIVETVKTDKLVVEKMNGTIAVVVVTDNLIAEQAGMVDELVVE